jgi:hypothetical protein
MDCDTLQCTADRDKNPRTFDVYNQLYVRHWDKWEVEGKMSRVFFVNLDSLNPFTWTNKTEPMDILGKNLIAASPIYPGGGGYGMQ